MDPSSKLGTGTPYQRLRKELYQSRPIAANNERNRCDSKHILSAFVFGSRITHNCALSPVHPQPRPFVLQRFLDFRAIFFPGRPLSFLTITIQQAIWQSPGTLLKASPNLHPFVLKGLVRTKTFFTLLLGAGLFREQI